MDIFSKTKRSNIMSKIRSSGNLSTEKALISLMRMNKIRGWRRYSKLFGKPDFVFTKEKLAIFVDGCFWHGCRFCASRPATNIEFWDAKIQKNKIRDHKVNTFLRKLGWSVIRIKECRLKKYPSAQISRIKKKLVRLA